MSLILNKYIGKTVEIRMRSEHISYIKGKILDIDDVCVEVELDRNNQTAFKGDICVIPMSTIAFMG